MDSQVQKAIEGQIPRAKMVSNIGAEMRYVLEHESSSKFKDVFQLLESKAYFVLYPHHFKENFYNYIMFGETLHSLRLRLLSNIDFKLLLD